MNGRERVLALIPIFNDWAVVALLLPKLDAALAEAHLEADVLLVDDGSTIPAATFECPALERVASVGVLELRRNLGHQRAIAVGLAYAYEHLSPTVVVVMDGDGEDDPADVPRLLARAAELDGQAIVFAERLRRSEPVVFKVLYRLYRWAHVVLTGHRVRVGNFSAIPAASLARLVVVSEMWNHYSAAVFNAKMSYATVPTGRGTRLGGRSHMSTIALVVHGLSALSVYSHVIGVRVLVASVVVVVAAVGALGALFAVHLADASPIPTWLPWVAALLAVVLMQAVTTALVFVFMMLSSRQGASVIPLRDHALFVHRFTRVRERG